MKWINSNDDQSNVEDRRGRVSRGAKIGGIGTIIAIALYFFTGQDFSSVINMFTESGGQQQGQEVIDQAKAGENEELKVFSVRVFNSCNDVWDKLLPTQAEIQYRDPKFVVFTDATQSDCGGANEAMGPFYCPADEKVYIDLNFFHELNTKFHASGDLAMAYVIAHEVGHHVQKVLGITDKIDQLRGRVSEKEFNKYSVRLELQADFLAGIWANYAQKMDIIKLEEGDIESALGAANAVGDDNIMKQTQGYVVPDAFTHGSSEQRMRWFMKGFKTGDINQGDTFSVTSL
ncbi:MAG: neutral zinc metallopeptidase [Paludibacteraceae bacterium]